ncbi:MAG: hypothetical protein ACYDCO_05135 [Armatimonadota bacterium]
MNINPVIRCYLCCLLTALSYGMAVAAPAEITLRARVVQITPANYLVRLNWRWGGEGLGGDVVRGELTAVSVKEPSLPDDPLAEPALPELEKPNPDVVIEHDKAKLLEYHWLKQGAWSPAQPLSVFRRSGQTFLTVTIIGKPIDKKETAKPLKNLLLEFELSYENKVIARFTEAGPDGPTVGIVLPLGAVNKDGSPTEAFAQNAMGLQQYIMRKVEALEGATWIQQPLPKRFAFITDFGGYGAGSGYGIRTTNREVIFAEARVLQQIGCNGLRNTPGFLREMIQRGEGIGLQFRRTWDGGGLGGYRIPMTEREEKTGRIKRVPPGAGCPYHPLQANRPAKVQQAVDRLMADVVRISGVEEQWLLSVDEIGSVFDGAPEGKEHMGSCSYCRKAFQDYVKSFGLTLEDFGAPSWDDIRPTYGYWSKTYEEQQREKAEAWKAYEASQDPEKPKGGAALAERGTALSVDPDAQVVDLTDEEAGKGKPAGTPDAKTPAEQKPLLSERGWKLLTYYSRRFNNDSSARLFTPMRDALERENEKKRKAIAEGRLDAPEAKQPWVYQYCLRGNTFLMGGHSLDFFDFYRQADNGFMYETSNRDPRVWQWDSYLCDVGRTLSERMGKRFGIYVKPHRGAPVQRMLAALSRDSKLIYWYTYGPEWSKGDTFGGNIEILKVCSRAARLAGGAEEVIYDAGWAKAAEVAVVRPRTSEIFENNDSWENGKWVYTALQHAHIPVDALDEGFLLSEELSRYKVIYVSGSHLRQDVAEKLGKWVAAGGVLYTSGGGLARNEADEPLTVLHEVLGLKSRGAADVWADSGRYGATGLGGPKKVKDPPPNGAALSWMEAPAETVPLVFGREVLDPTPGTEVLARYADGTAAITRHAQGKGAVYVVGFYAGLEYAVDTMKGDYNMATDYLPGKRRFVTLPLQAAGVIPVVDASHPLIEGILLKNRQTGKQAVTLMNWAYQGRGLVPQEGVTIRLRDPGNVAQARSLALGKTLPLAREGKDVIMKLDRLDEGDILLLD